MMLLDQLIVMSPGLWPNKSETQFLILFDNGYEKATFDLLLIEGQLLCSNEPSDNLEVENLRISSSLSIFLACFRLGHYNKMGGQKGSSKTYSNAKRFYYRPGIFDWICAMTADCLT